MSSGFFRRMKALIRKEFLQLSRDSSSLLLGIALPIILILIIGYGISLDVKNVPIAVVLEDPSPASQDVLSFMDGSEYFSPTYVTSFKEAEQMMTDRKVNAIIDVPSDFAARLHEGNAKMLLVLDGVETATAMSVQTYVDTSIASWEARHMSGAASFGTVTVEPRMWYNNANSSTWFFIPGLVMLIMTIIGVMLTSVVMAREWERGTFESLFVTPVKPMELVLAKMVPYFFIALLGTGICLVLKVPLQRPHGRFTFRHSWHIHDLPVGCAWHRADDFSRHEEPVPGLPAFAIDQFPSLLYFVRVHFRFTIDTDRRARCRGNPSLQPLSRLHPFALLIRQ